MTLRFATLGPADSNHALVLSRYLAARGLVGRQGLANAPGTPSAPGLTGAPGPGDPVADACVDITLIDDFPAAFEALVSGDHDYVLQVSAHPSHADCVGRFMHRAFPVDTFIAPSRPLALVARREIQTPRSVLRQPATRHYTDLGAWEEHDAKTIVAALDALLAGAADAAIVAADSLTKHPERLRLIRPLGAALDTWVLYANRPLEVDHTQGPWLANDGLLRAHFACSATRNRHN